jgi:dTDP-4-amino-4,6-dideoxygalactose transaminase
MIYQYDTTYGPKNEKIFSEMFQNGAISEGKYQNLLRNKLRIVTGCKYVFLTDSGTSALHIALLSLGVTQQNEVIIPSYLCHDVLNSINYTGANPRFVDINSYNYSMNISLVKKEISSKTKAIILPYMYGDIISLDELESLGIPIIEDIAHCTGGKINGKPVGSFGTVGMTSFGDRKYLDGGFGGAVFTNNHTIATKIQHLLDTRSSRKYSISYKYQIPNIIAAIIYEKTSLLNEYSKNRKKIAAYYMEKLQSKNLKFRYGSTNDSFFYRFMIDLQGNKKTFIKKMASKGIVCGVGVDYTLHKMVGAKQKLPNTDYASEKSVALPIRPNLSEHEMDLIIKAVCECL